ncbi:hypothetical protein [Parasitella parasitica]|uniref:UV excision repair protein RAD23 n=1 Tax=Parasitella parasitica TaxID=35722 RepID=A0A0B7NQ60_9FUNG|nr:hypothetical protein [Parasitella parasitica]
MIGKILEDGKTIQDYNIGEKDFLVVMISKPKATSSAAVTPASTPAVVQEPPAPTPAAAPSVVQETPATATATAIGTTESRSDNSLVTGPQLDSVIQNLMEMGFTREQCVRALRASFNNPDRAVEYLFNGIPQNILDEMDADQQAQQQGIQRPAATPAAAAPPSAQAASTVENDTGKALYAPLNLFAAAQQQAQQQQQQQQQSASGNVDFSRLRNTPYFQQIRQIALTNPAALHSLLQQLGQSNPELLRSIEANPNEFLRTLLEGSDDEEGAGSSMIQVTQEQKEAIDRLMDLGFERGQVIEAYFACDKNEELAANYLLEHQFDDGEE